MNENRISDLSLDDRPREKMLYKGAKSLSDSELVAILIGSGNKTQNAVQLAQVILKYYNNDVDLLAQASIEELMEFNGVGEAKAVSIVSALEFGKRRKPSQNRASIQSSDDAYDELKGVMMDLSHEEFWLLSLNRANEVLRKDLVSRGGMTGTVADPKIIFQRALKNKAVAIIVAHNHPSGQLNPSESDLKITKKLVEAGEVLEIPVLDHLIVTNKGYFSFADNGEL